MKLLRITLLLFVLMVVSAPYAMAQGEGSGKTVFDEAGVLSDADKQKVQAQFDRVREETGHPLYAFLVPDTNIKGDSARRALLEQRARQANVPKGAGVIVIAPNDGWSKVNVGELPGSSQSVYDAMEPDLRKGDYASGLVAGAQEIEGRASGTQGSPDPGSSSSDSGGLAIGGGTLLVLAALAGVAFFVRGRRRRIGELKKSRRVAEEEFAKLASRMEEFDERERLVSGYLEAQRPLLDQATEEKVETRIQDATSTGFAQELNEAAARLQSSPEEARRRIARGRELLEGAIKDLGEAEKAIDGYRAADEALDGKLREAAKEIESVEAAERPALEVGAAVQPTDLRAEHERLAEEVASRATHRDEFDPRRTLAALESLIEKARERRKALEDEVSSKAGLKETRRTTRGAIERAQKALEEYRKPYAAAEEKWGPAAVESAPSPEALSSDLDDAVALEQDAGGLEASGRFAQARSNLERARSAAKNVVVGAPAALRAAVVEADRKKREGEEKLKELEARLEQARANERFMSPLQRQQLKDYEYQLSNARSGFFGGDWLTALLLFEALDHNYAFIGGAPFIGAEGFGWGDWGGGDWNDGGDWGGGDWGGGDWGGGDW